MKNKITNKSFWYGILTAIILIVGIAATSKQLMGPTSPTIDNALVVWKGTSAYMTTNYGVTATFPATLVLAQSVNNIISLGTIGNGSTATLLSTNNVYSATFSGATATIALPASPGNGTWVVHGTTTYTGGEQVITIPSLIRPEFNSQTAITTITNAAVASSGQFTIGFTAIGGSFVKVSAIGDNFQ
jgi:hypothetical protein